MSLLIHEPRLGLPCITDPGRASSAIADLRDRSLLSADPDLAEWVRAVTDDPAGRRTLGSIFSNSPFLTACALAEISLLMQVLTRGPDSSLGRIVTRIKDELGREPAQDRLMQELRICRRQVALIAAIADLTAHWPLERVTYALSDFADAALSAAVSHLLRQAAAEGELILADGHFPEDDSGYVVLAMGKHGARELNYSSDIDLIILYDPLKIDYRGSRGLQQALLRISRQLVAILDHRTENGYVFRVDLRLRPDPSSVPIAMPYAAALAYYAARGETWERAAMIKARPVAGDIALGRQFLSELSSFVWREQMDFSMIRELQSLKKRINAHRGSGEVGFLGQNIKLGRGGIREIEFFTQTHQLIYGGADPYLRCQRTVDALTTLTEAGWIDDEVADELTEAYEFLRRLEHRLQMVDDQQTQTLPSDEAGIARIAGFMGFEDQADFRESLLHHLRRVESHYTRFFGESSPKAGIFAWTLASAPPKEKSVEALRQAGFKDAEGALRQLEAWHKGSLCPKGDERSRAAVAELIPEVVQAAGRTGNPDRTLQNLNGFLAGLDKGLSCFSLLSANPRILDLLVDISNAAPALAKLLARRPDQLQAALRADFFGVLPDERLLAAELADLMQQGSLPSALARTAAWAGECRLRIAAGLLRHRIDSSDAGQALQALADAILRGTAARLRRELARDDGPAPGDPTVVAVGRYGTGELAMRSAVDLWFLQEQAATTNASGPDLPRRLVEILSAPTGAGPLWEVSRVIRSLDEDPSNLPFLLALSQARVVVGSKIEAVGNLIRGMIAVPHDMARLAQAAADLRGAAIAAAADAFADPRRCRGGLDELELTVRLHQWRRAADLPAVLDPSVPRALAILGSLGAIPEPVVKRLLAAHRLLRQLECVLDVAAEEPIGRDQLPEGLLSLLLRAGGAGSLAQLEEAVEDARSAIGAAFDAVTERA